MKSYCGYPFYRIKIDDDGKYQSCCHQNGYYGNFLTDNISLKDAFKNSKLVEVKNSVLSPKLHNICNNTKCPMYYTDLEKNVDVSLNKYPSQIELSLISTWCNIGGITPTTETACIMCPRSSELYMEPYLAGRIKDNINDLLEIIKPGMPYLDTFTLLGIAEPFWKNKIFDIFDKIDFKKYKEQILFWTYSNATIFNNEKQDKFINEYTSRTCVGFSLDAATQETYKKIRRLDLYPTAIKNIENYFNKVNKLHIRRDWSFISHNINLLNLHEMEQMVRLGNSIGVDKIQFTLTHVSYDAINIDLSLLCNESNWKRFYDGQLRAEQVAKELNQKIEFYVPFHKGYLKLT